MKKIIYLLVAWRVFLFIPLFVSQIFLKLREGFNYTTPLHYIGSHNPISHFLFYPWANFDGVYYLSIAGSGYTVDNAGFFPLFPILINFLSLNSGVFTVQQFLVGMVLSSTLFLLSLIVFNKLLMLDYKRNISFHTILFLLLFPTSFFFVTIYSESLFFLLLIFSFYFARKENWFLSGIFAMLLTATRFVGIAIIPALLFEFFVQNKTFLSKKIISLLLAPIGILLYAWFNFSQWGNALHFIEAQGKVLNNRSVDEIILFPQAIFRYFKILTTTFVNYEWWIALLELSSFIFVSSLFYVAWKKKVRASYLIFGVLAFLIPASTGTFSGLPRYVLVLFPIFIALALIKNKWIKIAYSTVGIILLFILFMLFSKGYYIS